MKKRHLTWLVLFLAFSGLSREASPQPGVSTPIVVEGAQVWDGTGEPPLRDAVLVIAGDRIQAVGPRAGVAIPPDARIISARGKTIIPGIINAHGHVGMVKGLRAARENYTEENIRNQLRQYARYGVTAVMSLGTDFEPMFALRGPARPGEPVRAAVFTAGRGFTGKDGYPAVLPGNRGIPREVDTIQEVQDQIRQVAGQKVDMVKIWVDDHWGHYQKIRPELYEAIIQEAHRHNLRVMAHVFYLEDAKRLVAAGLDGMAHSVRDQEVDEELIRLLREKKTFVVPTLVREESTFIYAGAPAFLDDLFFSRWVAPEVIAALKDPSYGNRVKSDPDFSRYPGQLKMAQKNLKKLWDAGIRIAFGSDSGPPARFQGYFEHRELELMVEAGLRPEQALKAATLNAAESLGIDRDFGSLEEGKRADFIVLDGDPLQDILNTRKINQVWIGGRVLSEPRRINKVIELLESGQPVYYTGGRGGFEEGLRLAQTWADYINYEMEHAPFNVAALREFMQGLVKGGPTRSGHRTPAVIVTLPVGGLDETTVKANHWMVQQILATGVHGVLLCHARSPEAVRAFVEAARYPFHTQGVGPGGLGEGLRGNGGQSSAAQIWDVPVSEYLKKADVWPLNPEGELILGLKIEDKHALENAERSSRVPGIGFAEWGPGDMGMSLGYPDRHDPPYPPQMLQARARVLAACKAAGIAFLNQVTMDNIEEMIREGVMICSGAGPAVADKGRRFSGRTLPR